MSALSTARMKEFTLLKSVSVGRLFQTFITRLVENRLRTIWYNWAYIILAMSSCYITDEEHNVKKSSQDTSIRPKIIL